MFCGFMVEGLGVRIKDGRVVGTQLAKFAFPIATMQLSWGPDFVGLAP